MKEFMTVSRQLPCRYLPPFGQGLLHQLKSDMAPLQIYSKMVQKCFDDCVNDFTTKSLHSREESCVMRCVEKSQKAGERITQRFQEQNAAMMSSGQLPGRSL